MSPLFTSPPDPPRDTFSKRRTVEITESVREQLKHLDPETLAEFWEAVDDLITSDDPTKLPGVDLITRPADEGW